MKWFWWMYFLIGISHGVGALEANKEELPWWGPPAIVFGAGVFWPVVMALHVQEAIERGPPAKAASK